MLVLSRKSGEKIVMPSLGVEVTILETRGDRVRVGISAPADIQVHRREVWERLGPNGHRSPQLSGNEADRSRLTENPLS